MATIHQVRQRALVAAHRRYKALGFAYKIGPRVKQMLLGGLSQRQIAEELTRLGIPTASEWNHESKGSQPKGRKRWSQTQVARLLKNMGEVTKKMKWYYVHAHREVREAWSSDDPSRWQLHPATGQPSSDKLMKHTRKTPGEYYQKEANSYREDEMDKAGYVPRDNAPFEIQWRRFVNLRSYQRRKQRKAL